MEVQIHDTVAPKSAPMAQPGGAPGSAAAVMTGASEQRRVVSPSGRVIYWKPLSYLDQMKLAEIVGGKNALNDVFMGLAGIAYSVLKIDDDPTSRRAHSRLELDAIMTRLGDDGVEALAADADARRTAMDTVAEDTVTRAGN